MYTRTFPVSFPMSLKNLIFVLFHNINIEKGISLSIPGTFKVKLFAYYLQNFCEFC